MLANTINKTIGEAMKAHDEVRVSTLRLLSSAFNYEKIDKQHELTDEEEMIVTKREAKKRRDSIEAYEKGNRQDLADREKAELAILSEFLPAEISDDEIMKAVDDAIVETGATSVVDFGKVMKLVMVKLKGQVDGGKVSVILKQKLA
jgi:uncharacterized protein